MGKRLALFDFDGTLTTSDTLLGFAAHAVGRWRCLSALLQSMPHIILWKLGFISNAVAKQYLFRRLYRGVELQKLRRKGIGFIPAIDSLLRPEAYKAMRGHIASGDTVVIVSAAIDFRIEAWARKERVSKVIATEPEVDEEGKLTGRFSTPNCYGAEKVGRLRLSFPDLDKYEIVAYGNSRGDRELLALADRAVRF